MKVSVFVLMIVAVTLANVCCESAQYPGDPPDDANLKDSPLAKTTVKPARTASRTSRLNRKMDDGGFKKKSRTNKSRPSGRLNSWAPPPTPRSSLARRPRREIEYMNGHGHRHHGGRRGARIGVGIGVGLLGAIGVGLGLARPPPPPPPRVVVVRAAPVPVYRCRFVDRWGRCLDGHRGHHHGHPHGRHHGHHRYHHG